MKKFTIQLETLKTTRFFIFKKVFLNDECPICFDNILPETRTKIGCNHSFCIDCIKEHIIYSEDKKSLTCPCCRTPITNMKLLNKTEMNNIKNLVNVPEQCSDKTSEIRLYERSHERFIIVRSTDVRI